MKVALTPILNQMNVVGIVSIPGMMTGQILSGSDPSQVHRAELQRACLHGFLQEHRCLPQRQCMCAS